MYIILKGRVTLNKKHGKHDDVQMQISSIVDGDVFGELSIVDETDPSEVHLFSDVRTNF